MLWPNKPVHLTQQKPFESVPELVPSWAGLTLFEIMGGLPGSSHQLISNNTRSLGWEWCVCVFDAGFPLEGKEGGQTLLSWGGETNTLPSWGGEGGPTLCLHGRGDKLCFDGRGGDQHLCLHGGGGGGGGRGGC